MPEQTDDAASGVPAEAPIVGVGIPPAHQPLEVPPSLLARANLYNYVKREELCELTKTDKMTQRYLRNLKALEEEVMPTPEDIYEAEKQAKAWVAKVALLKNRRQHRKAEMETIRARIKQRLNTMSEMKLRSIVGNIRRVVALTRPG